MSELLNLKKKWFIFRRVYFWGRCTFHLIKWQINRTMKDDSCVSGNSSSWSVQMSKKIKVRFGESPPPPPARPPGSNKSNPQQSKETNDLKKVDIAHLAVTHRRAQRGERYPAGEHCHQRKEALFLSSDRIVWFAPGWRRRRRPPGAAQPRRRSRGCFYLTQIWSFFHVWTVLQWSWIRPTSDHIRNAGRMEYRRKLSQSIPVLASLSSA